MIIHKGGLNHGNGSNNLNFEEINANKAADNRKSLNANSNNNAGGSGILSSWFGGSGIGISDQIHEDREGDEVYDYSKFRDDQNYEVNKYMQTNIKPMQLPSVPTSLR